MPFYVLLKLDEGAAKKFVPKAGKKVLGVWEAFSEYCACSERKQRLADAWFTDELSGRRLCASCELPAKPVTTLKTRLQMVFIGRNIIGRFR